MMIAPVRSDLGIFLLSIVAAVALGLGVAMPGPLGSAGWIVVLGLAGVSVLIVAGKQTSRLLVVLCIAAVALSWSSISSIAGPLDTGRFVPPLILAFVVWGIPKARRPTAVSIRTVALFGLVVVVIAYVSVFTSLTPSDSLLKATALLVSTMGVLATLTLYARGAIDLGRLLAAVYVFLVASNVVFFAVGGGTAFSEGSSGFRLQGWTIDPNSLSILCGVAVPLVVARAFVTPGSRRWLFIALASVAVFITLFTGSRNGALAAAVGVFIVVRSMRVSRRLIRLIGFVTLVLCVVAVIGALSTQTNSLSAVGRVSDSGRLARWSVAWHEAETRPLLGAGFSSTDSRFAGFNFGPNNPPGGDFHNSYLQAAAELGFFGALPLVIAGLFALSFLVRRVPKSLGWAAGTAGATAVLAMFETGALTPGSLIFFPFWFSVGVLALERRRLRRGPERGSAAGPRQSALLEGGR